VLYFSLWFLFAFGLSAVWIYFRRIGNKPNWFFGKVVVNGKTFSYNNWIVTTGIYPLTPTE